MKFFATVFRPTLALIAFITIVQSFGGITDFKYFGDDHQKALSFDPHHFDDYGHAVEHGYGHGHGHGGYGHGHGHGGYGKKHGGYGHGHGGYGKKKHGGYGKKHGGYGKKHGGYGPDVIIVIE